MSYNIYKILWISFDSTPTADFKTAIERSTGCLVEVVGTALAAKDRLKKEKDMYGAIVVDSNGSIDNMRSIDDLRRTEPEITYILLYPTDSPVRLAALEAGLYRIVEKPVKTSEIVAITRTSIQYARLRAIKKELAGQHNFAPMRLTLLEAAHNLTQADEVNLVLQDSNSGRFEYFPDPFTGENYCQQLFENDQPLQEILEPGQTMQAIRDKLSPVFLKSNYCSWIGYPCPSSSANVGILFAFSNTPSLFENWERQVLLQDLAQQIGTAVRKSRALAELSTHNRYLDQLVEVGRQLADPQKLDDLYELAWKYVKDVFNVNTFLVALYDRSSDTLQFKKYVDENSTYLVENRRLGDGRANWGIAGYVAKTGQEIFWPTLEIGQQLHDQYHIAPFTRGKRCETCFFMPLKLGSEVIGVISIQSYKQYAFDSNLCNTFRALSAQLAVSIENQRLFQTEHVRSQEAAVMRTAGLQIAAHMDIPKIALCTLEELAKIVDYDCATVQLLKGEGDNQRFEIIESIGFPNPDEIIGISFSVKGDNPNRLIFTNHRPVILADAPASFPDFAEKPHQPAEIHSWMGIPMLVGDKLVGMIDLDKHECNYYNDTHAGQVSALAVQAALSIRNAQLYERTLNAKKYMQAIFEAGNDILSITGSHQLLQAIVEKASSASGAWRAALFSLKDQQGSNPQILATAGFKSGEDEHLEIRPNGISWTVFRTKEPSFHDIIRSDETTLHPNLYRQGVRAAACLPLVVGDQSIGVLWLHLREAHTFSDTEREALKLFASQSAIAYNRIQISEQVELARNEARSVAQTSTEGHLAPTLKSIVTSVAKVMKCDSVTLYVYHQDTDHFDFPPTLLDVANERDVQALGSVSSHSVVRKILDLDTAYEAEDARADPLMAGNFERKAGFSPFVVREGIASSMGIPLRIGNRKVGVMFINFKQRHPFTVEDRINAALFANQAAVAIQNAQLVDAAALSADLLRALHDAGADISNRLNLDDILKSIAHKAYDLIGLYGSSANLASVSLVDKQRHRLEFKAAYPDEIYECLSKLNLDVDLNSKVRLGICGLVATKGETILVPDVHADEFSHLYIPYDPNTCSELAVPIKVNGEVIAVINVEHSDHDNFDREDQNALEALADQVAIAVYSASDLQRRHKSDQMFYASTVLMSTTEPSQVLQMTVDTIKRSIDAWRAVALLIDPAMQEHRVVAQSGFEPAWKAATPIRATGISMHVMNSGEAVFKGDIQEGDPDVHPETIADQVRALACIPLQTDGKIIGVLWVHFNEPHSFSEEERKALMMYASQSALAYANARRVEEARLTNQMLENSTALAWMGMLSSIWRHSIEKQAETIRECVDLLRQAIESPTQNTARINKELAAIQKLALEIMEKPITPPLSSEEGIIQFNLTQMLNDRLMRLWRLEPYKQVQLTKELDDLPPMVRASPEWLRRSFDILIDNAIEAMKDCPIQKLAVSVKRSSNQPMVDILICDTGPGIPAGRRDSILKRPIIKQKGERGMGMGLLMAQMIIQTYGGTVQLESTGSEGTAFRITLPCE